MRENKVNIEELLLEDEFLSIYYDPSMETVFFNHKEEITDLDKYKEYLEKTIEFYKGLNCYKFAVDARKAGQVPIEIVQHIKMNVLPELAHHSKGNELYHAQLINKSLDDSAAVAILIKVSVKKSIKVEQFNNEEAYMEKLSSM